MISCWIISPTLFSSFVILSVMWPHLHYYICCFFILSPSTQEEEEEVAKGNWILFFIQHMYVCFSWNIQSDLIQGSLSFRENEICFHNQSPFRRYFYLPSGKFCIRENDISWCESIKADTYVIKYINREQISKNYR